MQENTWSDAEPTVISSTRELLESDRRGVLATVIDVEGSAYRRPGAKMLIPEDGGGIGSITAGCLEDEVLELASDVLADGHPRVETFDLMGDDDVWGLGVGCNGIIDLLLEPVGETYEPVLDAYEADKAVGSITVVASDDAAVDDWQRGYYRSEQGLTARTGSFPNYLQDALADAATHLTQNGKADTVEVEGPSGTIHVFIDGITPPPKLIVVGTGHDVQPVVELGKKNDFRTIVVGFRGGDAIPENFPDADAVHSTSPVNIRDILDIDENTYVVVMTHNFIDDRLAMGELVDSPAPYVGLMGPGERFGEMLKDFDSEGRTFSDAELDSVYTPIGLDLGGGTPYQIAHSIIAELLTVHNDRRPAHLSEREGPIHERVNANPIQ